MRHIKTPVKVGSYVYYDHTVPLLDADDESIGQVYVGRGDPAIAEIVTALNAHDALVEAATEAYRLLWALPQHLSVQFLDELDVPETRERLRAALALARGEGDQ